MVANGEVGGIHRQSYSYETIRKGRINYLKFPYYASITLPMFSDNNELGPCITSFACSLYQKMCWMEQKMEQTQLFAPFFGKCVLKDVVLESNPL